MPILRDNGPLLSHDSAHQVRIHTSWPLGYVQRLYRRSSSVQGFRSARDEFVSRLRRAGAPQLLINYVIDNTDYYKPYFQVTNVRRQPVQSQRFLVLPFHPVWDAAGIPRAVSRFACEPMHRRMFQEAYSNSWPFPVTVSWKLVAAPLGTSLVEW